MIRRMLSLLTVVLLLLTGWVVAEDPPANNKEDGLPLRLKRKKRDGETDKAPLEKKAEKSQPQEKEKEKEDLLIPEDGPPPEAEDEKDVLERISRNMRDVEEKLANRELGEPTAQQQRDILRDIDSLIRKSEQSSGGGGGAQNPPQNDQQDQPQDQQQQQGGAQQPDGGGERQPGQQKGGGMRPSGREQAKSGSGKRPRRELRSEREGRQRLDRAMAKNQPQPGGNPPPMKPNPQGDQPGAGGDGPRKDRLHDDPVIKDIWGHLPESLRAEMNAYSNPQPFLPRYDRLIREYYRTIAEQGRKKGD